MQFNEKTTSTILAFTIFSRSLAFCELPQPNRSTLSQLLVKGALEHGKDEIGVKVQIGRISIFSKKRK